MIESFLGELGKIHSRFVDEENSRKKKGEFFNVFDILGVSTKEVKTHTPFLCEMLRPNGAHGMGVAPLLSFLSTIGYPEYLIVGKAIVKREFPIGIIDADSENGGQIDIIVEDGNKAIIIENKINAPDQPEQLIRYLNYAQATYPKGFVLLYLTLDEHEASSSSITGKEKTLQKGKDYFTISYKEHISRWIEDCLKQSEDKPIVRETLKQYLNLIKRLTNTMNNNEEILALMEKNPEAVALVINNSGDYYKRIIAKRLKNDLEDFARDKDLKICYSQKDFYSGARNSWAGFQKKTWQNAMVRISQDKNNNYYIGVTSIIEGKRLKTENYSIKSLPKNPEIDWRFGWAWLPNGYWNMYSINTVEAIRTGKFIEVVGQLVLDIIEETEEKYPNISMVELTD